MEARNNGRRMLTIRDIESMLQDTVQALNRPEDRQAQLDAIDMLIACKSALALEHISINVRDIRDTLQGKTYKP